MKIDVQLFLLSWLSLSLPLLATAQGATVEKKPEAAATCKFSCPEVDTASAPLVKRPHAIGYDSFYSIFECIYNTPAAKTPEHKCSYYKTSGLHALGYAGDNCPPNAVPCPESQGAKSPMFSDQEKDEVPPWVESGRYLLYLHEHPPS